MQRAATTSPDNRLSAFEFADLLRFCLWVGSAVFVVLCRWIRCCEYGLHVFDELALGFGVYSTKRCVLVCQTRAMFGFVNSGLEIRFRFAGFGEGSSGLLAF